MSISFLQFRCCIPMVSKFVIKLLFAQKWLIRSRKNEYSTSSQNSEIFSQLWGFFKLFIQVQLIH